MVGETAKRKRAPCLALLLVMLMVLLRTSDCGATSSIMKGYAISPYHTRIDEPADWMFDSEIARMLIDYNKYVARGSDNRKTAAVPCGQGTQYKKCLPDANQASQTREKCARYKRGCKP